jgi:hypothetical protein
MYRNFPVFIDNETEERFVKAPGVDQYLLEDDFLGDGGHVYRLSDFEGGLQPTGESHQVPAGIY